MQQTCKKLTFLKYFPFENAYALEFYCQVKINENKCYVWCKEFLVISLDYLFQK